MLHTEANSGSYCQYGGFFHHALKENLTSINSVSYQDESSSYISKNKEVSNGPKVAPLQESKQ